MTEAPVIAADRFPVVLMDETGTVTHPKARVILTQPENGIGRITAWITPENIVLDTNYDREASQFGPRSQDWYVQTDLGEVIIRALGGCGCGDRLKHWVPEQFQPYRIGRPLR
jgi:hypothetical protein